MKILLVDDFPVVLHGLKRLLLEAYPKAELIEVIDGSSVLELSKSSKWDLIILDIQLGTRDGLEILKELISHNKNQRVLILSMFSEEIYALRAMKLGAHGYITKQSAPEELISAVNRILGGNKYISNNFAQKLANNSRNKTSLLPHEKLSEREMQVLSQIVKGKEVGEISKSLFLSVSTISTYRHRILTKMEMKTNSELITYAFRNQLF